MNVTFRPARLNDIPRIWQIRHGTAENRLSDPSKVSNEEVIWYIEKAITLISEDADGIQGFMCANPLNAYIWALFVIDGKHGIGHGTILMDEAEKRLAALGHRQVYLTTGPGTRAEEWYKRRGYRVTGLSFGEDLVLVKAL
jgi:GNAT superfamily N-acetyltransferase